MDEEDVSYRSCRICSCTNSDDDFVSLYETNYDYDNDKPLSAAGKLYEELLGCKMDVTEPAYYPQCVCNSCNLQMKLFKDLKKKALKTLRELEFQNSKEVGNEHTVSTGAIEKTQREQHKLFEIISTATGIDQDSKRNNDNDSQHSQQSELGYGHIDHNEECHKDEDMNNMFIFFDNNYDEILGVNEKLDFTNIQSEKNTVLEAPIDGDLKDTNISIDVQDFNEELTTRQNQTSNTNGSDTPSFKCNNCDAELPTLRQLRMHRQQNHPFVHRCTECSKLLRSAEALEVHMKQHLGLPAYSCEQCNKTFKQKVHYQYHIKRHNNERNFNCKECGKGYVSKSDLTIHMRQHSGFRPYKCSIKDCNKKYYTEQHLKMHMHYHNNQKSFECDICHRKFVSPTVLHTHRHTIHVERRFECTECGKKFRRKHHLENHSFTHEKNSVVTENFPLLENFTNIDVTEQALTTNEFSFENFIEIDENEGDATYTDDEFLKGAIESCAESGDESDLTCYNIYST